MKHIQTNSDLFMNTMLHTQEISASKFTHNEVSTAFCQVVARCVGAKVLFIILTRSQIIPIGVGYNTVHGYGQGRLRCPLHSNASRVNDMPAMQWLLPTAKCHSSEKTNAE